MKNYNNTTSNYLSAHGLVRVWVRDVLGQETLLQVTKKRADALQKQNRIVRHG